MQGAEKIFYFSVKWIPNNRQVYFLDLSEKRDQKN